MGGQPFKPHYPIYVIASEDMVPVISDAGGTECLLLCNSLEVAEMYVEVNRAAGVNVIAAMIQSETELLDLLRAVRDDVQYFNWNTVPTPSFFALQSIDEIILSLENEGEGELNA